MRVFFCGFLFLFVQSIVVNAQQPQFPQKSIKRQEIDAKRTVADINSNDAIYRGREFIRMDSTYYIGWMYEGAYKYNHAADFLGYKNAIAPLSRALKDLSRDYAKQLRTRTNSLIVYYPAYQFQLDYSFIVSMLIECYSNINQPAKAFELTMQARKWNFQRDYYFSPYAYLCWIVHRNRFYTHSKYFFLENSIKQNEALANRYLDSGLVQVDKNARLNATIFQPGYLKIEKQTIYHYKAILYGYSLQIDSAMHYYRMMMDGPLFSYNNYATFLSVCGDFKDAMHNYEIAGSRDQGDKRLKEWAYYSSILNIYQDKPDKAAKEMKDMITAVGSTPGFGWYNIALARAECYAGNLKESEIHATKASQFKEVNIGTTLGQSQYNFSVNLINLMNDLRSIQEVKFENSDWWYNLFLWPKLSKLSAQRYLQQYLLVNQLAMNPERDNVIYPLFSSENTVGWDEIWYLIQDFSTSFFYKKFQSEFKNDKRRLVKKYYLLFMAKLQIEQGKYVDAKAKLNSILQYPDIDHQYGKLLLARTYEALSICENKMDNNASAQKSTYYFYEQFPQLVPYSDVEMNFRLSVNGSNENFISRLKDLRINWTTDNSAFIPVVHLNFQKSVGKQFVTFFVSGINGEELLPRQTYYYKNPEQAAIHVAYALFKINHKQD